MYFFSGMENKCMYMNLILFEEDEEFISSDQRKNVKFEHTLSAGKAWIYCSRIILSISREETRENNNDFQAEMHFDKRRDGCGITLMKNFEEKEEKENIFFWKAKQKTEIRGKKMLLWHLFFFSFIYYVWYLDVGF